MRKHILILILMIFPIIGMAQDNDTSKFEYIILRTVTFDGSEKGLVISDNFERVETTIYISKNNIHILNSHFTFRLKVLKIANENNFYMISCIDVDTDKRLDFTMNIPKKGEKKTMAMLLNDDGEGFCFETFLK